MKKYISLILVGILSLGLLAGCSNKPDDEKPLKDVEYLPNIEFDDSFKSDFYRDLGVEEERYKNFEFTPINAMLDISVLKITDTTKELRTNSWEYGEDIYFVENVTAEYDPLDLFVWVDKKIYPVSYAVEYHVVSYDEIAELLKDYRNTPVEIPETFFGKAAVSAWYKNEDKNYNIPKTLIEIYYPEIISHFNLSEGDVKNCYAVMTHPEIDRELSIRYEILIAEYESEGNKQEIKNSIESRRYNNGDFYTFVSSTYIEGDGILIWIAMDTDGEMFDNTVEFYKNYLKNNLK